MASDPQPQGAAIEDYFVEDRTFPPPADFAADSLVSGAEIYDEAEADWQGFWARQAADLVSWYDEWHTILDWQLPFAKWFVGGTLNVSYNCLDRHVEAGHGQKVAYHWEGEPGDHRTITYADLLDSVQRFANALKGLGVGKGDRVAIYMPMIPELPVAMLACARIGAPHSVVFGGFSADSLADRINDAECTVLVTADGGFRRGEAHLLKPIADLALASTPSIEHVVVVDRVTSHADAGDVAVHMTEGRDLWFHDLMDEAAPVCEPERMDSEDLLYLLYTSGTTAKPKGIMHTTGGYLTQVAFTHKYVFDLAPESDVYWCAADIGWVTGHSYIVYGPLANGATSVIYEGTPDTPGKDRLWDIAERYGVTILYTAPTAIRTFMKWGTQEPERHDLTKLRLLGSVGEPINPEAWMWYHTHIGGGRCPIVDTWWQTETGAIMIAPLPGATTLKPGSATFPLPGIGAEVVDEEGKRIERGGGYLTLTRPWPSMLRGIYGDPERYRDTYWSRFGDRYFAGDGCKVDDDGYLWLLGRVDDVMNVSGHRISTTEVESALVDHPAVAESAVCGATDAVTGQAIVAFVTVRGGVDADPALGEELRGHVATKIGPTARPKLVVFTDELPKTRSGKIMRRELRDASAIGTVWQRAALVGYEGIFPPDVPPPSPELLTERSRQAIAAQGYNTLVLVACHTGPDGSVVGTIAAAPDPDETTRAQLLRLYVDPGHWGRGIGRRLHDTALGHLQHAGYRVVVLWVLERNVRARAMYERWGWRATPARQTDYPGVTEVCYLLML